MGALKGTVEMGTNQTGQLRWVKTTGAKVLCGSDPGDQHVPPWASTGLLGVGHGEGPLERPSRQDGRPQRGCGGQPGVT